MMERNKKFDIFSKEATAFTLAETMIVLAILGVVAAITVPALVRHHVEAQNRTKIKKAMTVYDMAINKIIVENNLKSEGAVENWANANGPCTNSSGEFKVSENITENGVINVCKFKDANGIWWDITDILNPTIGLRAGDLDENSDSNTRFKLLSHFDKNGSLRVDDLAYEQTLENNAGNIMSMAKLFEFINTDKENIGVIEYGTPTFSLEYGEPTNCEPIYAEGEIVSYRCDVSATIKSSMGHMEVDNGKCYVFPSNMDLKKCENGSYFDFSGKILNIPLNNKGEWDEYGCTPEGENAMCSNEYYGLNYKRVYSNGDIIVETGNISGKGNVDVGALPFNYGSTEQLNIKCEGNSVCKANETRNGIEYDLEISYMLPNNNPNNEENGGFFVSSYKGSFTTKDGKQGIIDSDGEFIVDGIRYSYCVPPDRLCYDENNEIAIEW